MNDIEKRRARRRYASGVLEFYDPDGELMMGVGRLLDLSITGGLIETNLTLTPGQILRLCLRLEGNPPLELMAKVIRVLGKGSRLAYGIKFGSLSSGELSQIKNLL